MTYYRGRAVESYFVAIFESSKTANSRCFLTDTAQIVSAAHCHLHEEERDEQTLSIATEWRALADWLTKRNNRVYLCCLEFLSGILTIPAFLLLEACQTQASVGTLTQR